MDGDNLLTFMDLRGRDSGELPAGAAPPSHVAVAATEAIIADVRRRGDAALRELGERFDGAAPASLEVSVSERLEALEALDEATRGALREAVRRIRDFHLRSAEEHRLSEGARLPLTETEESEAAPRWLDCCDPQPFSGSSDDAGEDAGGLTGGLSVRRIVQPVRRAGLYVPGGRAAYPSTVLMTALPAKAAGVQQVAVCVPPGPDGRVAPVTLAATALARVDEVYAVGGAGAIAAMAYGTETIPPVDVIAGPGNVYVALAKQRVAGDVGVAAAFTGPSEVVVVADESVPPHLAALDLIVQAEHGPDGMACLLTWNPDVLRAVSAAVEEETAKASRKDEIRATLRSSGYAVLVSGPDQVAEVVNHVAPEHLQLMVADPSGILGKIRNAGAVFCGENSPASLGDYAAGPSHVLPTGRSARYAEALGVRDFCKEMHVIAASAEGLRELGPIVETLAEAEGLPAHAESVRRRLDLLEDAPGADLSDARLTVNPRPAPREGVARMRGYHSPQVEADVRLNTNESPFEPPPELRRRLTEAAGEIGWNRYPERQPEELHEAIAELHSVNASEVFAAKGSNEVIQCLCLAYAGAGRRVAVFSPTYALHPHIARLTGAEVLEAQRGDDFRLDPQESAAFIIRTRPSVVFLCSPNNPTGTVEGEEAISAAVQATASVGGVLLLDEAYAQFAPKADVSWRVDDDAPVLLTRTFSKYWAMAGTRLGYSLGPSWLTRELQKVALPYHIDAFTQRAGLIALDFRQEMAERAAGLVAERERLAAGLATLPVRQWPSGANFILFRAEGRSGDDIWQALLEQSVLVRNCSSWPGLKDCLRVTVGAPGEIDAFLAALGGILL